MAYVLTKSAKGLREATGKTGELSKDMCDVLKACKGAFVVEQIVEGLPADEQEAFVLVVRKLLDDDFLHEVQEIEIHDEHQPAELEANSTGLIDQNKVLTAELVILAGETARRFLAHAERSEEDKERLRIELENEKRKAALKLRWAEQKVVIEESQAAALREAEEQRQRQNEIDARMKTESAAAEEAMEIARIEAAEKSALKAQEVARRVEERRIRIEAEAWAQAEADEKARIEAEERASRKAAEKARKEQEERSRREAVAKAKAEAEEQERIEAEQNRIELIRERIRGVKHRNNTIGGVTASLASLVAMLLGVKMISFDAKRAEFEALAMQAIGVPVKAATARVELFPQFRWVLDGVAIGEGDGKVVVSTIRLGAPFTAIFSLPAKFSSLQLDGMKLPLTLAIDAMNHNTSKIPLIAEKAALSNVVLVSEHFPATPLDVDLDLVDGRINGLVASNEGDDRGPLRIEAKQRTGNWDIAVSAKKFSIPFGIDMDFADVSIKGLLGPDRLDQADFAGSLLSGEVRFNGNFSWQGGWSLNGNCIVSHIDMSKLARGWFKDGFASSEGTLTASAPSSGDLYSSAVGVGSFKIGNGWLQGIDLDRVLQNNGTGEQFHFDEIVGRYRFAGKRADITDISISAKTLSSRGRVSIDEKQAVTGRFGIEVRTSSIRLSSGFVVGGTAVQPRFQSHWQ